MGLDLLLRFQLHKCNMVKIEIDPEGPGHVMGHDVE
jgi:hypothetical protein